MSAPSRSSSSLTRTTARPRRVWQALWALAPVLVLGTSAVGWAQDSDGDAIGDLADAFPCDPAYAGQFFAPAEGQSGALLFEDQWPNLGDADFNDAIISYNYVFLTNAQGQIIEIIATLDALALGGVFDNGLGLHLPVPAAGATVTRTVGTGAPQTLPISTGDAELTVALSHNLREFFGDAPGQLNSISGPSVDGVHMVVHIRLGSPAGTHIVPSAPFDLYLFRSDRPAHEIHRTMYPGTASMDSSLFGTASDRSAPGHSFVDGRGLPFALDLPAIDVWPSEATDIALLFPDIIGFATSGGTSNQNFYATNVQRGQAFAGSPAIVAALPPSIVGATACTADSDGDGYTAGEELANGTREDDFDDPPLSRLATFVDLSGGSSSSCLIDELGRIHCWGSGGIAVTDAPKTAGWSKISSGGHATCAVSAANSLHCWGNDRYGAVSGAPTQGGFSRVSVYGYSHGCALHTSGAISCWGRGDGGNAVAGAPAGTGFVDVATGGRQSCALRADETLYCWGASASYAPAGAGWASLHAGSDSACAIDSAGQIVCWDLNGPVVGAPTSPGWTELSLGYRYGCAVGGAGNIACWGIDASGTITNAPTTGTWTKVSAGNPACALNDLGEVSCWGSDLGSMISHAPHTRRLSSTNPGSTNMCAVNIDGTVACSGHDYSGLFAGLSSLTDVAQLSHANSLACALTSAGQLSCWGRDDRGSVTGAPSTGVFTDVASSGTFGCAIDSTGGLTCWGDNRFGQRNAPAGSWAGVDAGALHACAVSTTGTLGCWGYEYAGSVSGAPVGGTWAAVSSGFYANCAIDVSGALSCWGDDRTGVVTNAPTSGTWASVAVWDHACAIDTAGHITCWGDDASPEVSGAPTTGQWASVAVASPVSCAISVSGHQSCWGNPAFSAGPFIVAPDADRDGLGDEAEMTIGTDPNRADTDGDGRRDGYEVNVGGTNPLLAD